MGLGRSDATLRYRLMPSARSEMKSAMRDLAGGRSLNGTCTCRCDDRSSCLIATIRSHHGEHEGSARIEATRNRAHHAITARIADRRSIARYGRIARYDRAARY